MEVMEVMEVGGGDGGDGGGWLMEGFADMLYSERFTGSLVVLCDYGHGTGLRG